jgi:hypothetical protein
VLFAALLYLFLPPPSPPDKTFSADEAAVYRSFLEKYAATRNLKGAGINLSSRSGPLNERAKECLETVKAEKPKSSARPFLKAQFESLPYIMLVNPGQQLEKIKKNDSPRVTSQQMAQSGMLTVSQIWFDKDHHFAVMSFSFYCGRRCGHGSTHIFRKVKGQWVQLEHLCESWISANPLERQILARRTLRARIVPLLFHPS